MKLILVRSGDGKQFLVGEVADLKEATEMVQQLDSAFFDWEVLHCPPFAKDSKEPFAKVLPSYEGCDLYVLGNPDDKGRIADGWLLDECDAWGKVEFGSGYECAREFCALCGGLGPLEEKDGQWVCAAGCDEDD